MPREFDNLIDLPGYEIKAFDGLDLGRVLIPENYVGGIYQGLNSMSSPRSPRMRCAQILAWAILPGGGSLIFFDIKRPKGEEKQCAAHAFCDMAGADVHGAQGFV